LAKAKRHRRDSPKGIGGKIRASTSRPDGKSETHRFPDKDLGTLRSLLNCRSLGRFGDLVMTPKYVDAAHSVQNDKAA
jgi:hypothetical protein